MPKTYHFLPTQTLRKKSLDLVKKNTSMLIFITLFTIPGPLLGQSTDELLQGLNDCSKIQSVASRVDCFDQLAAGAAEIHTENNQIIEHNENLPSISRSSDPVPNNSVTTDFIEEDFGFEDDAVIEARQNQELISNIVEIEQLRARKVQLTLANGQVWRQKNIANYRLRVGYEIRIYPSGWGSNSFRLSSRRLGGYIPIERIR